MYTKSIYNIQSTDHLFIWIWSVLRKLIMSSFHHQWVWTTSINTCLVQWH